LNALSVKRAEGRRRRSGSKEGWAIPNTKSAKKALRQSLVRRQRNLRRKQAMRRAIEAGDREKAEGLVPQLMSVVDKAAKHRTIHPNKAARIKAKWMKRLREAFASS